MSTETSTGTGTAREKAGAGTFVLVPGYWLGAWAWDEVAAALRAAGHEVHAVTPSGQAERAGGDVSGIDVDTHIADIARVVEDGGLERVVLVAHSGANMAVTGAADRMPGRIARVVYVDTGPMPSGMAAIDFHEPSERAELERAVAEEGGGRVIPVPPFDPAADPVNLAGLSAARLAELRERATPQPFGTATQPAARPDPLPDTPRTLVACTIPLAAVRQMGEEGNPIFAGMTGPTWTYRELPTGHWPMLSAPRELAALLDELAALG
ncbi:alpha/beta hydrolase [Actinomadura geliboluensis]|uniref:Alpha/beta fold hydrolase n=1 Tax=Actinomadura geliboluensis TaxID=882440 RepID=A0A5S4G8Y7_9ACTN|nr:alpha/beta hydrolase family protein [Actinomadura geliboluensis]TMR29322.1 alpha/beta fold hydrolase [Actinomadura geliboluensis]